MLQVGSSSSSSSSSSAGFHELPAIIRFGGLNSKGDGVSSSSGPCSC